MTPEELANIELSKLKKQKELTFPIDPFNILKLSGVNIIFREFEKLDGIIMKDKDNLILVGINSLNNWQRQRFTAAHEYCHLIKDIEFTKDKVNIIKCNKNSLSKIEKYANDFAGYLLMPTVELSRMCNKYKNKNGYIDFESVTIIAEYFGVSFSSCLYRIAYGLNLIDGDISKECLVSRMKKYGISYKRNELIKNTNDYDLLSNIVSSLDRFMLNFNKYNGQKFLQNYIYNDNKLEGINISRSKFNYILADLNFNKNNSKFFSSYNENIVMTIGNLELQKYVITTDDEIKFINCGYLHTLLFKYVPFPEDNGRFRNESALIKLGTIQPVAANKIYQKLQLLDDELQKLIKNILKMDIGEYIERVAFLIYNFIVIHPFRDGNGRISRAILNWLLCKKGIAPIYIDESCRKEYYDSLSAIDKNGDYKLFVMFIEKRIIETMIEVHKYLFVDDIDE